MCCTEKFEERVVDTVSQILQRRMQQQQHHSLIESEILLAGSGFDAATECRLEAMEQYNRRDSLLFFGLYEMEFEDCTEKVVRAAHQKGAGNITAGDVSISHRLPTRNHRKDEPRRNNAKFFRKSVKNESFQSEYRLKESLDHYNVYVQEQITRTRSQAFYRIEEGGSESVLMSPDFCTPTMKK